MKYIKVKHSGHCIECNEWIMAGEFAIWIEGVGIKHEECKEPIQEDDSRLVVIDPDPDFYLKK